MKQFYYSLFLFISFNLFLNAQTYPTGSSEEVGITSGELSVSLSGAANYTIPISVPPGINGIVPKISLAYSSQGGNGVAGYGWNIAGVSTISRIPSTKYHDNIIDPVDFDVYDRFAFDGQRLLIKEGSGTTYGGDNTVYETESFSNIKITSHGVHPNGSNFGPSYFIVEYPDGSKAYYGSSTDSRSITDWSITYWENPQGVRISYSYLLNNNVLDIASIKYGTLSATAPINEIKFNYQTRTRTEQGYIGGLSISRKNLLASINVIGNGTGFRNYYMQYNLASLDYQRLRDITEKNGDNSRSYNPTIFEYGTSNNAITVNSTAYPLGLGEINANNSATIAGDFDGDAKMDFVLYSIATGINSQKDFWMFKGFDNSSLITPTKVNCGSFGAIFPFNGLTSNGKMYHYQGVTVSQADLSDLNAVNFKSYYNSSTGVVLDNTKKALFPERWIQDCTNSFIGTQGKFIFSGDFNGDGLTDAMALDQDFQELYCNPDPYGGPDIYNYSINSTSQFYFVDLDRRKTTDFVNYAGQLQDYFLSTDSKIETFDVNGDGKTDILHFKNGKVYVYTLNNNNQLEFLWKTLDTDIKINQPILSGDYNGDGKMDFITPTSTGLYASSYVKFLSTGSGFVRSPETYPFINMGNSNDGQGIYTCSLIPLDINADGKTDIVQCRSVFGNAFNGARVLMNVYKNTTTSFSASSTYDTGALQAIRSYPLPVFLSPKTNNQYLSLGVISNNQIYTFDSKNDFTKERLLLSIRTGNGVKETITYSPLQQDMYDPLYTPSIFTETFPNIDIVAAPSLKIVTMLENQSASGSKKQLFHYAGAVSNSSGLGFLGFRATMRTNWYNDDSKMISNIFKNDISLRGANIENYSVLGYASPNFIPTSTFISKTILGYNSASEALQTNKVFKLKNISAKEFDGLENTSRETTLEYNSVNNPTKSTTVVKDDGATIQETISSISYKDPTVTPYFLGIPSSKTQSISVTGSQMLTEEFYDYSSDGLLTEIRKKGTNTDFIKEKNTFDLYGNVVAKTFIAGNLTPRTSSYIYDNSGRFLTQSTDIENLIKTFTYNIYNGLVTSETNENGLTTSYLYDSWFKKTLTTDYLGKSSKTTYSKSVEKSIVTTISEDGSAREETFDDLGRKTKAGIKNIMGSYSYISYQYDIEDRNVKISEPYIGSTPSLWNETQYDAYGRVIINKASTGKTVDISYPAALTTRTVEGSKSKLSTRNAIGNVISVEDSPGGKITYKYYANGNLMESNYGNVKTTITQDGWGRKTGISDSSAGNYSYDYNEFGETTKVTTPNGFILYKINNVGKIEQKRIGVGNDTISRTTYTYDGATKLLTKSNFEDLKNSTTTNIVYQYDIKKRIDKTVETTPYATFTKELAFDAFGRIDTETSTALLGSKSTSKLITNTYLNGTHYQILDNGTVLWQANEFDAKGQLKKAINGPVTIDYMYDDSGFAKEFKYTKTSGSTNILTLTSTFEASTGNLQNRTNNLFAWNETPRYDNLERLIEYNNHTGLTENQSYDDNGRIAQNSIGTYKYSSDKPYQNSSIQTTAESLAYYSAKPILTISYNPFKSPIQIEETGIDKISFTYNDSNERSVMYYGGLQDEKLSRQYRKHYSADGSMEIKENRLTGEFDFFTFIGGDAYSAPLVFKTDGGINQNYLYFLRDYQNSIIAVVNQSGTILEKRLFDAWGGIIKVEDGAGNILSGLSIIDRGYTGHEHLQSVGLIHMNARLYDSKLHRFLQPDNYVQDPFNTQNYNRYSYCWNNPFKYTDPSGEWIHIVVGAVIGGFVNWGMHGFQLNGKGLLAFGIGAAGGAMMASGNVAGLSFFQAGMMTASYAVAGTMFTGVANHMAFGDAMPTMKQIAVMAAVSFVTGGIFRAPRVPVSKVSELTPAGIAAAKTESSIFTSTTSTTIQNTAAQATTEATEEVAKAGLNFKTWTNAEGQLQFSANAIKAEPLQEVIVKTGGRLGNEATRLQISQISTALEQRGYEIIRGGQRGFKEEYLKPLLGGRNGGSYLDITAKHPEYGILRINTVDVMADGITPTARELINAARIRTQIAPGEHLLLIPKN